MEAGRRCPTSCGIAMEGWRSKRRLPPRLTSSAAATQVALACASAAEAVSAFLARLAPYRMRVPGGACRSGVGLVLDGSDIGACWSGAIPALVQHISSTSSARRPLGVAGACWLGVNTTPTPRQHHINTAPSHTRGCSHDLARPESEDPVRPPSQDAISSGIRNFDWLSKADS